ncbi:hypothetical protein [Bradyrhizobium sp. AZCC 2289]|uniref:hypothetical protein n=1 Tax=Bradyrhizobium sp. AZCC 2289 TaxID=3117026 RepID=UPI002FF39F62
MKPASVYKGPSAFDPCPEGKVPGIRVWQNIGSKFQLGLSAENPQTAYFGGNTLFVGTPAVGPQGVLNPNLLVNLTGPGGSFFNNANNLGLNRIPDITAKAAWDSVAWRQQIPC